MLLDTGLFNKGVKNDFKFKTRIPYAHEINEPVELKELMNKINSVNC